MKLRTLGTGAFLYLIAGACTSWEEPMDESEFVGEFEEELDTQGFFPARGYFLTEDGVAGDCLVNSKNASLPIDVVQAANTGGQEVIFVFSEVKSSDEMQKKLDIKASASASFLVGSGSAKFSFSEETAFSDTSVTLLVSVIVRNTAWTVNPDVKLAPDAEVLLRPPADLARFRERCGDGFLHSYTTGGEFHAFIEVETKSAEEKRAISSSVQGSYLKVASGSASFESEVQRIVSSASTNVRSFQVGGAAAGTTPCTTVSCIAQRVNDFTSAVAQAPVVFAAEVVPYHVLTMPTDGVSPVDVATTIDRMESINRQRNDTKDLLNRFLAVQQNPIAYSLGGSNATMSQVTTAIDTLNSNLNSLNLALRTCAQTYSSCNLPSVGTVSVAPPPLILAAGDVVLRPYEAPSEFLTNGGATPAGCSTTGGLMRGLSVTAQPLTNVTYTLTPGLVPSLTPDATTVSFQAKWMPQNVMRVHQGYVSCNNSLSLFDKSLLGTTGSEWASFYRVPGLNGQPNTWSFRVYHTNAAPPSGGPDFRNRDASMYLSRIASNNFQVVKVLSSSTSATKNQATWFVDKP